MGSETIRGASVPGLEGLISGAPEVPVVGGLVGASIVVAYHSLLSSRMLLRMDSILADTATTSVSVASCAVISNAGIVRS